MNANIVSHNFSFVNLFVNENSNISRKFSKFFQFFKNIFARIKFLLANLPQNPDKTSRSSPPLTKARAHAHKEPCKYGPTRSVYAARAHRVLAVSALAKLIFLYLLIIMAYYSDLFAPALLVFAKFPGNTSPSFDTQAPPVSHTSQQTKGGGLQKCNPPFQKFQRVFCASLPFCVRVA